MEILSMILVTILVGILALAIILMIFGIPILYIYNEFQENRAIDGKLPFPFRKTKNNFIRIHIMVAANLMLQDRTEFNAKRIYIRKYLYKLYGSKTNFGKDYQLYFKHTPKTKYIANWLNKYLKYEKQKKDFLRFMLYICVLDSKLTEKEKNYLVNFSLQIGINASWMKDQFTYYDEQFQKQKENYQPVNQRIKLAEHYAEILGVSTNSSFQEIKKAYRDLVKKYHPDKLGKVTKTELDKANKRFLEIQQAYEYFQ